MSSATDRPVRSLQRGSPFAIARRIRVEETVPRRGKRTTGTRRSARVASEFLSVERSRASG